MVATVVDAERCAAELQLAEEANETLLGPVRQQLEQGLKIYNAKEDAKVRVRSFSHFVLSPTDELVFWVVDYHNDKYVHSM